MSSELIEPEQSAFGGSISRNITYDRMIAQDTDPNALAKSYTPAIKQR